MLCNILTVLDDEKFNIKPTLAGKIWTDDVNSWWTNHQLQHKEHIAKCDERKRDLIELERLQKKLGLK